MITSNSFYTWYFSRADLFFKINLIKNAIGVNVPNDLHVQDRRSVGRDLGSRLFVKAIVAATHIFQSCQDDTRYKIQESLFYVGYI